MRWRYPYQSTALGAFVLRAVSECCSPLALPFPIPIPVAVAVGVNILFFGDWWQLPPVLATALFDNPFKNAHPHRVLRMMEMFWTRGPDSINQLHELTREVRVKDRWLQQFLEECRHGRQSESMYNFVHGSPTREPGSRMAQDNSLLCANATCQELMHTTWPEMVKTLQDFVKQTVAPYKYPRAIEFRPALPRSEVGKLLRYRLRENNKP